ncbi:MAG: hypothetical protein R3F36_12715 [Candidatus Competibacteraceae bacterium]
MLGLIAGAPPEAGCSATPCPVGALLGLVSRFALFKIRIPRMPACCAPRCSIHCKAGCIRLKTKEVDFSRCVACFNCMTVCETHGIGYAWSGPVPLRRSSPVAFAAATVEFPDTVHRAALSRTEGAAGVVARGRDGAGRVGESASVVKRRSQAEQPRSHSIGQRQDLAGGAARRP